MARLFTRIDAGLCWLAECWNNMPLKKGLMLDGTGKKEYIYHRLAGRIIHDKLLKEKGKEE